MMRSEKSLPFTLKKMDAAKNYYRGSHGSADALLLIKFAESLVK
jgi:hypothetical protein